MQNVECKMHNIRIERLLLYALLLLLAILFWVSLPKPLFEDPVSTVLLLNIEH